MTHASQAEKPSGDKIPVIDLSKAPGERAAWDRSKLVVYFWAICELVFITNPWQVSSRLRVDVLKLFGAQIGKDVVFRPRTRVKFPWKLHIGDRSWIGEGVWFHNQDHVYVGHDAVISQETFITTGSHALRRDMALITRRVDIADGAWVTARCIVLGGASVGRSAIVAPGTVVRGVIEPNSIFEGDPARRTGTRF